MQWSDTAIVLRLHKYGEQSGILTVLTATHGLYTGMVRGAFSTKNRGMYQTGNIVEVTWQARMPEHLGTFQCGLTESIAAKVMHNPFRLLGLSATTQLLGAILPEHEPHENIFQLYINILTILTQEQTEDITWLEEVIRLEMALLADLGYGLDITACAATGVTGDLQYVSPKTGRAISEAAGRPYCDKLLALPPFLRYSGTPVSGKDIQKGLQLTGYFLNRYLFLPRRRTLPEARVR